MKAFKTLDIFIQLALILFIVAGLMLNDESLNPGMFLLAVGCWQLLSLLIHAAIGKRPWKCTQWRKYHLIGIGVVLLFIIIAMVQGSGSGSGDKDDKYSMEGLGTLIFAMIPALLCAAFYVLISFREWSQIRKQE